jgi:Rrf2 family protein
MLSRKTDYALRALVYLKENPDRRVPTREIAEVVGIPYKFLTQIFLDLVRHGLVVSERGSRGGMALRDKPENISFLRIVEAVEGPFHLHQCLSDQNEECFFKHGCPLKARLSEIERTTRAILASTTLDSVDASGYIQQHLAGRR